MGKGTIKSEVGDGQYNIETLFDVARLTSRADSLNSKLSTISAEILTSAATLASAQAAFNAKPSDPILKAALDAAKINLNRLNLQKLSAEKQIDALANVPEAEEITAWCADLTEGLTGDIATIETPGERGRVQIRQGYNNGAVYNQSRDGIIQPSIAGTSANVYYNWAILPGWQKWKPTYRYGVITSINDDADTCNLTLDAAISSQQALDINQATTLSAVPIVYMDCNAEIFEVGDHVVIDFTDQKWGSPRVVGFYDNPKPCSIYLQITINGIIPQKIKRIRLWHPNYGEVWVGYSDSQGRVNLKNLPGHSYISDCYIFLDRSNYRYDEEVLIHQTAGNWSYYYYEPDYLFIDQETDWPLVTAVAVISNDVIYVLFKPYLPANHGGFFFMDVVLPDLPAANAGKTITVCNSSASQTYFVVNGVELQADDSVEFTWTGTAWEALGSRYSGSTEVIHVETVTSTFYSQSLTRVTIGKNSPSQYELLGVWPSIYKIIQPVEWVRSANTLASYGGTDGGTIDYIGTVLTVDKASPYFSGSSLCENPCYPVKVNLFDSDVSQVTSYGGTTSYLHVHGYCLDPEYAWTRGPRTWFGSNLSMVADSLTLLCSDRNGAGTPAFTAGEMSFGVHLNYFDLHFYPANDDNATLCDETAWYSSDYLWAYDKRALIAGDF